MTPLLCLSSSSVWSTGFVDVGSRRISWFVFGRVLRHYSTMPVPFGSDIRDLSPSLLRHLPHHCTSDGISHNPHLRIWLWGQSEMRDVHLWCNRHTGTKAADTWRPSQHILMHFLYKNNHFVQSSATQSHPVVGPGNQRHTKTLCSGRAETNHHIVSLFNFLFPAN